MKKKILYTSIFLCLIFFFAACKENQSKNEISVPQSSVSSNSKEKIEKSQIPTIFVHGYGGGKGSFGSMIKRMQKLNYTKKELVLFVSANGEIQANGQLTGEKTNPSIQVIFEDNKSHEWNQAEWIKKCMQYVYDTYSVTEINLVGHSMGGVSALRYMTTYGNETNVPHVTKFVAIASPFNNFMELPQTETADTVIANGPSIQSERYADFVSGMNKVSVNMPVLLIAGDVGDGSLSDETVELTDALSVASLFVEHGNSVEEQILKGKNAQHSQLHENKEVDQLVANFLWTKDK